MAVYRVAKPSEYLAVTGWGIEEIQITKKAWIFFGQSYTVLDLTPVIHTFEVQAMSAEKLPFILPVIFTIGPHNHKKSLIKYAKLMSPHDKPSNHIRELVKGVIEGETRVLAASMIMEQIFKGTNEFKQQVLDKVQQELKKFGLLIYNAYVNQLINVPGHKYFSYLGQKTQMEEVNQETIDVMEAKKKSEVGLKEELYVCSDAKISENKRETEIVDANADLATEMEKTAEVEVAKAETIQEVEHQNAMMDTAKSKAELLSKATVQEANSQLHQKEKVAKTESYEQANVADSIMWLSDATAEALMKRSDAMADSIMKRSDAMAEALAKRSDAMAEALTKRSDAIHHALEGWDVIAEVQRECVWNNDHLF